MYIIKNALKCIGRSKGRNVLIGIIVLVIAVSACLGLSIRQAAESAKAETLEGLSVTATISVDRQSMMQNMRPPQLGENGQSGRPQDSFDRDEFKDKMNQTQALTLEEYQIYAQAEVVQGFYYTLTTSLNGNGDFEPVTTETNEESDSNSDNNQDSKFPGNPGMGGFGGMGSNMFSMSDFQVVGYSDDSAMTSFVSGTASITEGAVFEYNTDAECIISQELATYNELNVGDTVTVTNPRAEDETYMLTVVGIYTNTAGNESNFSMKGMNAADPANQIYMSYEALQTVIDASGAKDEDNALTGTLSATYTFNDVDSYGAFEEQARALGLSEDYSISSQDVQNYENSLVPLNTLSTMAGWFLLVVLVIGAIILIVLNIFNVRERKYEIGVLTAMGMKKIKVAAQFLTEIFTVTLAAVILGLVIGAVTALPVTNRLLEEQVSSQQTQIQQVENNFGRPLDINGGANRGEGFVQPPDSGGFRDRIEDFGNRGVEYVSQINSAMNFTVVLQMFGIAMGLTLVAGAVSVLFVMRYEPLKILANRD